MSKFNFVNHFFGSSNRSASKAKRQRGRVLRIEELESREMLSVTIGATTITNSIISDNIAFCGGGIYISGDYGETATLTNCTISSNTSSSSGGGIYSMGTMAVTNCTISGNSSISFGYVGGGGIYNGGAMTVTNCTISGNIASNCGGGIGNGGSMAVMNSTISGNLVSSSVSSCGGGIYIQTGRSIYYDEVVMITNSVVSGNTASNGGGIYIATGSGYKGRVTITNSTIAGNKATEGGGIHFNGKTIPLTLNNTIVAQNTGYDVFRTEGTLSGNNNLLGNGEGQTVFLNGVNGCIIGVNPMFVNFIPYTTWTSELWKYWDLRLAASSPAIDAGRNTLAVDADGKPLTVDMEDKTRIVNGTVDVGAYEFSGTSQTKLSSPTLGTLTATSSSTFSVNWTAVANASGYDVQYRTATGSWQTTNVIVNGTSATISGLAVNTTYYVQIRAIGTGSYSNSDWSNEKSATTDKTELTAPTLNSISGITAGEALNVSWTASGNANTNTRYTVQWKLTSAADSTYSVTGVTVANSGAGTTATITGLVAGNYTIRLVAADSTGTMDSADPVTGTATVNAPTATPTVPTISVHPQSAGYTQGQTATPLSVTASGNGTLSYQWYKSGSSTVLATSQTYTPPTSTIGTESYHCVVTNTLNGSSKIAQSDTATITVNAPTATPTVPTLSLQPQSAGYTQGQTATALSVTASGNGTLTYQWFRTGSSTVHATTQNYTPPTSTVGTESYYCVVTNTLNGLSETAQSDAAVITVNAPTASPTVPTISVQPQSASYTQGQTATALSVTASGNGTLTYAWYKTGNTTVLATSQTYTPSTSTIGTESYYCVVTNTLNGSSKTAQSDTATITVNSATVNPPTTPTNFRSTNQASTAITLQWNSVTNADSYKLEWSANGTSGWTQIGGTLTATSYTHNSLSSDTNYYYRVSAVNTAGTSAASDVLQTKTQPPAASVPAAPTGLTSTNQTTTSISLTCSNCK